MQCLTRWLVATLVLSPTFAFSSPPGGPPPLPKANVEAMEKLKEAYAAYVQGQYQRAIRLALEVYQKYGDVQAKWFPSWVRRFVKESLPDPYDKEQVLSRTIGSFETHRPFLYTMAIRNTFPSYLLAFSYAELGNLEETAKWAETLRKLGREQEAMMVLSRYSHYRRLGLHQPTPPRETWRPLPLRFREEDYFVLVPLDDACKVLGLSCSIAPNPKMAGGKGIRISKPDMPNVALRLFLGRPLVERLENGRGRTETLAYAPYEEDGEVWVPFYWLAKQVGIRWWEVRNGKIYVAPPKR